jgi:hypothetical protein
LDALQFIEFIRKNDLSGAIEFSQENLSNYSSDLLFPTKQRGQEVSIPVGDIMAIICYPDLLDRKEDDLSQEETDLIFMLSDQQRTMVADQLNS